MAPRQRAEHALLVPGHEPADVADFLCRHTKRFQHGPDDFRCEVLHHLFANVRRDDATFFALAGNIGAPRM
jgi:hypothetical protein